MQHGTGEGEDDDDDDDKIIYLNWRNTDLEIPSVE